MMLKQSNKIRHIKLLCVGLTIGLGSTACATNKVTVNEQAAPITYKINGEGAGQYASIRRNINIGSPRIGPVISPLRTAPEYNVSQTAPHYTAPTAPIAPRVPVIPFDANAVDKELYAHQQVRNTYTINGKSYTPKHEPNYDETGLASWYGPKFNGKPTASGEIFDKQDITAAHKTLPLNSLVHVTNLENGRTLIVRVNDRGPFVDERIIDLSEGSAQALGTIENGLAKVRVRYAGPADPSATKRLYEAPAPTPQPLSAERPQIITPQPALPQAALPQAALPQAALPQATLPSQVQQQPQIDYQPLRYLGEDQAPILTQPQPQPERVSQAELPRPSYETPQPQAPRYVAPHTPFMPAPISPDRLAPVAPPRPEQGGNVTLTIKGPIHFATQSETDPQPKWIPAVNKVKTTR